jgi:uncharacterized protein
VPVAVSSLIPGSWASLDHDPPLFASQAWLDSMASRIEGSHRWFVSHPASPRGVGFFGSVIADNGVSEAKNPWRLLFEPCAVRSLTDEAIGQQAAARRGGPSREHWFPALVLTYPGLECFPVGQGRQSPDSLDEIIAGIVAHAREAGLRCVAFLYVQPEERELPSALRRAGFLEFPIALRANLRLPGTSFSDYLAALGKKSRL